MTERDAAIIRTGTPAPAPAAVVLDAGPVRVVFADGDLRQVRRDGTEIVRRIYVAVRDLDWNTLPGEISDLEIADDSGKFRIRFTRRLPCARTSHARRFQTGAGPSDTYGLP